MVVVVDVPDGQSLGAVFFAGPDEGVEELFGQDPVVALDFAVMAWGVGRDELMSGAVQDVGEVLGSVAGAVIGDDPLDVVDAVSGEPYPGSVHESDCCDCSFVFEC